jgi:hypothetical protein
MAGDVKHSCLSLNKSVAQEGNYFLSLPKTGFEPLKK